MSERHTDIGSGYRRSGRGFGVGRYEACRRDHVHGLPPDLHGSTFHSGSENAFHERRATQCPNGPKNVIQPGTATWSAALTIDTCLVLAASGVEGCPSLGP
jgi:hypothetical protein